MDEFSKEIAIINAIKKKTVDDIARRAKLEWHGGLYLNDKGHPCIPAVNIHACIRDGAKNEKLGKDVQRYVFVVEHNCDLLYTGPKDVEKLWENGKFIDQRPAGVKANKVLRTRPIFHDWSVVFHLEWDEAYMNVDAVKRAVEHSGRACGLCDGKPMYGRFGVEYLKA